MLACGVLATLAGCLPLRVDIDEKLAGGYTATAWQCDAEAETRIRAEAQHFCEARKLKAGTVDIRTVANGGNCSLQGSFWCHPPDRGF